MPLNLAPLGKEVVIIKTALDVKTKRHLCNLGILVGGKITPTADNKGDLIIKVKEGRVALNKALASKILVH